MNRPDDKPVDKFGFPMPIDSIGGEAGGALRRKRRGGRWPIFLLLTAFLLAGGYGLLRSPIFADIRDNIAKESIDRAVQRLQFENDVEGALRELNIAVYLSPDNPDARHVRACVLVDAGDLDGAMEDANRLVELQPNSANGYSIRGHVLHCKEMHVEAVADAKKALEIRGLDCPFSLNSLAYARALANVELPEALRDVEKALSAEIAPFTEAAFLDTRGYLKHLLGDSVGAQKDLTVAINSTEAHLRQDRPRRRGPRGNRIDAGRQDRQFRGSLSVMYYHRGLVRQALGHPAAEADLQTARDFGYNPAQGNY